MSKRKIGTILIFVSALIVWVLLEMLDIKYTKEVDSYYQTQTDSLRTEIAYKQKQIDSLKTVLRVHDDTIFVIERQKPIITNKYYYDEKVYLTSSDSANYELRLLNQRQFEVDYFGGRFNPKD